MSVVGFVVAAGLRNHLHRDQLVHIVVEAVAVAGHTRLRSCTAVEEGGDHQRVVAGTEAVEAVDTAEEGAADIAVAAAEEGAADIAVAAVAAAVDTEAAEEAAIPSNQRFHHLAWNEERCYDLALENQMIAHC